MTNDNCPVCDSQGDGALCADHRARAAQILRAQPASSGGFGCLVLAPILLLGLAGGPLVLLVALGRYALKVW